MFLQKIALLGGIFAILVFIHFFVDWLFQTHSEAMIKHNHYKIRAKHCLIYALGFVPIMLLFNLSILQLAIAFNILFWSHFYLDTYHLVYIWAKYIRKPPEMIEPYKEVLLREDGEQFFKVCPPNPKKGFGEFVQTPIGKILLIAVDQIFHLAFLFPIAWFMVNKIIF